MRYFAIATFVSHADFYIILRQELCLLSGVWLVSPVIMTYSIYSKDAASSIYKYTCVAALAGKTR